MLKKDGYQWNDKKVVLSALIKGCKLKNDMVITRLPIQSKLLDMILFELERYCRGNMQQYTEILYKAVFLIMYYGMMRVGEVAESPHAIKAANIHIGSNEDKILVILYSSKNHGKESKPQKSKISALQGNNIKEKFFCPFSALRQYLNIRGPYVDETEQFFVWPDRSPLKPVQVRSTLRFMLKKLNLSAELYNTHSMRGGRSVDLSRFGYSVQEIRARGRWRSNVVYRYLTT